MNTEIFKAWYLSDFILELKRHQGKTREQGKVLLILDNAPSHCAIELNTLINEMFHIIFLLANVTSMLQPMYQIAIEKMKRLYSRKRVLQRMLLEVNKNVQTVRFVNNLRNFRKAWKKLLHDMEIQKCPARRNCDREELFNIHEDANRITCYINYEIEDTEEWLKA